MLLTGAFVRLQTESVSVVSASCVAIAVYAGGRAAQLVDEVALQLDAEIPCVCVPHEIPRPHKRLAAIMIFHYDVTHDRQVEG